VSSGPFVGAIAVLDRARGGGRGGQARAAGRSQRGPFAPSPFHHTALARIKAAVAHFPAYATPRKVLLTLEPWTVDAGLMTPTLKLKRQAIEDAFAVEIAALYAR